MFGLGFGELLLILVIVLFFFGGKKLPELGNSLGKSIQAFKKGMKDDDDKTKKS
ncbi:MAG: twin-arginine translocase TatA/TatE family subunit [Bacteriovoracaceae bacterium]